MRPDILVQPDLCGVDLEDARTFDWAEMTTLLLAVEVLSRSTARYDRFAKRRLYQEVAVPLHWIVDPDQKAVEVWMPEAQFPSIEWEHIEWKPEGAAELFLLELEELFRPL